MNLDTLTTFLDGGRVILNLVVALCFARLGRATNDRLYYLFAGAFVLLSVSSSMIGMRIAFGDYSVLAYVPRLIAFLTIIYAIIDKNARARAASAD